MPFLDYSSYQIDPLQLAKRPWYSCLGCQHRWQPRRKHWVDNGQLPKACPNCHRYSWNDPAVKHWSARSHKPRPFGIQEQNGKLWRMEQAVRAQRGYSLPKQPRRVVNMRMDRELLAEIDRAAEVARMSRSAWIEAALVRTLSRERAVNAAAEARYAAEMGNKPDGMGTPGDGWSTGRGDG